MASLAVGESRVTEPTPRQLAILVAWVEAGSSQAAGEFLGISADSVRHALSIIQDVLGASSSAQAFAIAIQRGLIDPHALHIDEAA